MSSASPSMRLLTASLTVSSRRPPSAFHSRFQMSNWPAGKAKRVVAALERIGWHVKRQRGSHRFLARPIGRITNSHFTITRKPDPGCWQGSLSIPG
jgi:predicted RNA binding protein YcfA (HicA-like mRNA interferase family)